MATPKKKKTATYLVFISYSTTDQWIARQIADQIGAKGKRLGVRVFLSEKDTEVGELIAESVWGNLRKCQEFVVLLTRQSCRRPWVLMETGGAIALEKWVAGIVHQVTPKDLPPSISGYKRIDLNDLNQYIAQLLDRVRASANPDHG